MTRDAALDDGALEALLARARDGERASAGRLLSVIERGGDSGARLSRLAHRSPASAPVVGLTGAPGVGKSSLVAAMVDDPRAERAAVLAVDPSSPVSGGALLGDRIRLGESSSVFFRSVASRASTGGIALMVPAATRVLDAAGFTPVLVETVGVGQVEVDIAGVADTTVVVVTPNWGDAVQASKAGLLELADIFVVNQADRPRAASAQRELEAMLDLAHLDPDVAWRPPVLATVAVEGRGVGELWDAIERHHEHLAATGALAARRRRRARALVSAALDEVTSSRSRDALRSAAGELLVDAVDRGEMAADDAAGRLLPEIARAADVDQAKRSDSVG